MRRKRIWLALSGVVAVLLLVNVAVWHFASRGRLISLVPQMVRNTLLEQERMMPNYNVWPTEIRLVLSKPLQNQFSGSGEFSRALAPARVFVETEDEAKRDGRLSEARCDSCVALSYDELSNNPLFARTSIVLWRHGLAGAGYEEFFVHALGHWVHLRTRMVWIS